MGARRPKWRMALHGGVPHVLSAAFIAGREATRFSAPRCQGTTRTEPPRPCRMWALKGATLCKRHGGLLASAKAEAERLGRPVVILRRSRNTALAKRGLEEAWPAGLPMLDRFQVLGPYQRGRLFEAWENRLTAPDAWQNELDMPRYRHERGDK